MISIFFFSSRRRHTRFKCDWSSDVCSSDLVWKPASLAGVDTLASDAGFHTIYLHPNFDARLGSLKFSYDSPYEIGRASGRERVEISVVAVSLKKKKRKMWAVE